MNKAFILISFIWVASAYAGSLNRHDWEGVPTVYLVNAGASKKALCAGVAKMWSTGLNNSKEPEISRAFVLCEATGHERGYTCPAADRCMDHTLAQGVYLGPTPVSLAITEDDEPKAPRKKKSLRDLASEINQKAD